MSTSGTVTFRTNRDSIIHGALRLVQAEDPESTSTVSTTQINNAAEALNIFVKSLQTKGLQLWERKYAVVFPQKSQPVYVLGGPGPAGDHACLSTPLGTGFVSTTITSISSTTLVVGTTSTISTAGIPAITMADGWNIGIMMDSGYWHWTTINGAPSGTTVTLAAATSSTASAGNTVVAYQTKLFRPLRILDGFVRMSQGNDVPCLIIPRENYNRFGVKTSAGTSIQLYYDPQANSGNLYIYPSPTTATNLLYLEIQKPIDDFSSASDDFDLPQEWAGFLKFGLAKLIAPEYGVSKEKFAQLVALADEAFSQVNGWDQEAASVYLQPTLWQY